MSITADILQITSENTLFSVLKSDYPNWFSTFIHRSTYNRRRRKLQSYIAMVAQSITLSYQKSERWHFSMNWVYGTGQAITLPVLAYQTPSFEFFNPQLPNYNQLQYTQGERNAYRMRPYHRLDVSVQKRRIHTWGNSVFEFGLYNAYSRNNPSFTNSVCPMVYLKYNPFHYYQYYLRFPIQ